MASTPLSIASAQACHRLARVLAGDDDLGEAERLAAIIRTLSDAEAATTMLPSFAAHLADDEGYG